MLALQLVSALSIFIHVSDFATGKLRFQAPTPPANVSGVQPATAFGAQCNQAGMGSKATDPGFMMNLTMEKRQTVATSEDCLFIESAQIIYATFIG